MALGIRKENEIYSVLSIPLEWESNQILANHFRMLADEIEQSGISIFEARITSPVNQQCSKPTFQLVGFCSDEN